MNGVHIHCNGTSGLNFFNDSTNLVDQVLNENGFMSPRYVEFSLPVSYEIELLGNYGRHLLSE